MKRADALAHLRIAGYHNDSRAFVRLYVENRISRKAADEAYRTGKRQRAGGMPCHCHECKKPEDKNERAS